jgi:hypothetical protein
VSRRRNGCGHCRRNGIVKVPASWVQAADLLYADGGGKVKLHWAELPYAQDPKSRISKGLSKLYPDGTLTFKLGVKHMASALGSTPYPKPGGVLAMDLRPDLPHNATLIHEMRHVVQHLGDMALRATMSAKDKKRVAQSGKGKLSGRFGRPKPRTVKALRGWKSQVKAGKAKGSKTEWYYRSPSEYQPHVGDAAAAVLRKLPDYPTEADVRNLIRKVTAKRALFMHLSTKEKRDALTSVYGMVMNTIDP